MLEGTLEVTLSMVDRYGLVVLLAVFVLEGALIGKIIPTRGLLIAVVIAAGTGLFSYATVIAAAVLGATIGQSVLFVLIRRREFDPAAHPRVPIAPEHVERAESWLERWGPAAIVVSNSLPVARGSMTVPTAMGQVSGYKFSLYSLVGSVLYISIIVGVAGGIVTVGSNAGFELEAVAALIGGW